MKHPVLGRQPTIQSVRYSCDQGYDPSAWYPHNGLDPRPKVQAVPSGRSARGQGRLHGESQDGGHAEQDRGDGEDPQEAQDLMPKLAHRVVRLGELSEILTECTLCVISRDILFSIFSMFTKPLG